MSSISRNITIDDPLFGEELRVFRGSYLQIDFTTEDSAGAAVVLTAATVKFTAWDIQAGANEFQLIAQPVTGGTWASSVVTFTCTAHGYAAADIVIVEDAGNTNYNGTYTVVAAPTADTFTAALVADPGAWTTNGYVSESTARIEMTTPASGLFTVHLRDTQTDTDCKTYRYSVWIKLTGGAEHHAVAGNLRILDTSYAGN